MATMRERCHCISRRATDGDGRFSGSSVLIWKSYPERITCSVIIRKMKMFSEVFGGDHTKDEDVLAEVFGERHGLFWV
jgi:hypothetical protein